VFDGLEDEFARRYDPMFSWIDMKPLPADEIGSQEMVKSWREGAWRNAERLLNAGSDAERQQVAQSIEDNAASWARMMAAPQEPGYRAQRDAYCAAHVGTNGSSAAPGGRVRAVPRCTSRPVRRHVARRRRVAARRRHVAHRRAVSRRRRAHRRSTRRTTCRRPARPG
jgi:hypothetical protein